MQVDGAFLQGLAAIILALISLTGVITAFFKRQGIRDWITDRTIIIGERDSASSAARMLEIRATMAEQLGKNAQGLLDRLEKLESAFDDVVTWTDSVADYAVFIESRAVAAGVDLQGRTMPAPPPRLAAYLAEARSRRAVAQDA